MIHCVVANQFRALEEDEIMFLDSIREKQEEEERQRKEKDGEEVRNFKEYVSHLRLLALVSPYLRFLLQSSRCAHECG